VVKPRLSPESRGFRSPSTWESNPREKSETFGKIR
jgi:hypothetical protein